MISKSEPSALRKSYIWVNIVKYWKHPQMWRGQVSTQPCPATPVWEGVGSQQDHSTLSHIPKWRCSPLAIQLFLCMLNKGLDFWTLAVGVKVEESAFWKLGAWHHRDGRGKMKGREGKGLGYLLGNGWTRFQSCDAVSVALWIYLLWYERKEIWNTQE